MQPACDCDNCLTISQSDCENCLKCIEKQVTGEAQGSYNPKVLRPRLKKFLWGREYIKSSILAQLLDQSYLISDSL